MSKRFKSKKCGEIKSQSPKLYNEYKPKTQNQFDYVRAIVESDVIVCHGYAGTGKSMTAIAIASEYLIEGKINNILISKSIIGCDNEIGYLPGNVGSKIEPYMIPYLDYFEYFLGRDLFYKLYRDNRIKFQPVELLRGHTYNDAFLIAEESQNMTPKQIKMFLTRIGRNSKAILIGDDKQSDIKNSGLKFVLDKMKNIKNLSIIEMQKQDILRHPIIPSILEVFDENGV